MFSATRNADDTRVEVYDAAVTPHENPLWDTMHNHCSTAALETIQSANQSPLGSRTSIQNTDA